MKSQPLQTAFTSMTIALVIFLSIWVIQASQEEFSDKSHLPLQVKSDTQPRESRDESRPDPFDNSVPQAPLLTETTIDRNSTSKQIPTIQMQSIEVRTVSDEEPAKPSAEENPFAVDESISLTVPEPSSPPPTLELPEINITPSNEEPVADSLETERSAAPLSLMEAAEIERIKQAMAEETAARNQLQSKIDSLTQEQSKLKSALEREQEALSLAEQQKKSFAEKLGKSESELTRLKTTTSELRSEAVEMKNSLNRVTNEFDSLRKRFEDLQKKPRELSSLTLPKTASEVPPPPEATSPQTSDQFVPPIRSDEKSGIPLAPPTEDASQEPLIEADPMFGEPQALDAHYPPMVACGETCTETVEKQPRGLLPKLFRRYKSKHSESCNLCTESEPLAPSCTETGTCEQTEPRRRGLFYRLKDLMHKDEQLNTEVCQTVSAEACGCGCHSQPSRGLIPKVARWIEARNTFGCYNECGCGGY